MSRYSNPRPAIYVCLIVCLIVAGVVLLVVGNDVAMIHRATASTRPAVTSQPVWVDEGMLYDVRPVYNDLHHSGEAVVEADAPHSTTHVFIWVAQPVSVTDWNAHVSLCPSQSLVKIGSQTYTYTNGH